jgi:predicted transcriptional regulator
LLCRTSIHLGWGARCPGAPGQGLNILEEKGHLTHEQVGNRYVYRPTHPRDAAGKAALQRVLQTFYEGSIANSVAALLDAESLAPEELAELTRLINKARKEGR